MKDDRLKFACTKDNEKNEQPITLLHFSNFNLCFTLICNNNKS